MPEIWSDISRTETLFPGQQKIWVPFSVSYLLPLLHFIFNLVYMLIFHLPCRAHVKPKYYEIRAILHVFDLDDVDDFRPSYLGRIV